MHNFAHMKYKHKSVLECIKSLNASLVIKLLQINMIYVTEIRKQNMVLTVKIILLIIIKKDECSLY